MLKRNWNRAKAIVRRELVDLIRNEHYYFASISYLATNLERYKPSQTDPDRDIIEITTACTMIVKALIENIDDTYD